MYFRKQIQQQQKKKSYIFHSDLYNKSLVDLANVVLLMKMRKFRIAEFETLSGFKIPNSKSGFTRFSDNTENICDVTIGYTQSAVTRKRAVSAVRTAYTGIPDDLYINEKKKNKKYRIVE